MLAGGLNAIQNTVIVTSLPFLVIIAGVAVSFWKELVSDRRQATEALAAQRSAVTHPHRHGPGRRDRLSTDRRRPPSSKQEDRHEHR